MKNQIQIFSNPEFGVIRTLTDANNEPLFCLADVCKMLDLTSTEVVRRLDKGVFSKHPLSTKGGKQLVTFVNEDGLYDVILDSRKPEARTIRKWVTSEVLPSIRKDGGYMVPIPEETDAEAMARGLLIAQRTIESANNRADYETKRAESYKRQTFKMQGQIDAAGKHISKLLPAATFAKAVETSPNSILVEVLAKILKQNGIDIGQNRLYEWLREKGYVSKRRGESWNLPTQRSIDAGILEIKPGTMDIHGISVPTATTKVTGKGQIYFVNKFMINKANENAKRIL